MSINIDTLPDGRYFDGTYEWDKEGTDWTPLRAPFGMPTRPDLAGLRRVVTTYEPISGPPTNVTTPDVEGIARVLGEHQPDDDNGAYGDRYTYVGCTCGWSDWISDSGDTAWASAYATHQADALTPLLAEAEARGASRATDRIAERLWVEARRHDARQVGFSAIGDAYAGAALIAKQTGDDRG